MNAVFRRTWALAFALLGVGVIDAVAHLDDAAEERALPGVAPVPADAIRRLELTKGDVTVVLEQDGEGWRITSPIAFAADPGSVSAIVGLLRNGVEMDVRVDQGHHEDYGLVNPDAILVEAYGDAGRLAGLYVGHNTAGGGTFVRLPDDDTVFRARIGGRHRFDRTPSGWRDHRVLDFDPDLVVRLEIERADETIALVRTPAGLDENGNPRLGPWKLAEDPAFAVDQPSADDLARTLSHLRAGEILSGDHPSGTDDPAAAVTVHLATDEAWVLLLGRTDDGVFAHKQGATEVYRIAGSTLDKADRSLAAWRDRQLVDLEPATVQAIELVEPGLTTTIAREAGSWKVTRPKNVDVDPRMAEGAAQALAKLRAEEMVAVAPGAAGFPTKTSVVLQVDGGGQVVLELGGPVPGRPEGQEAVYVRTADQPERIGTLPALLVSRIRKVFAR